MENSSNKGVEIKFNRVVRDLNIFLTNWQAEY